MLSKRCSKGKESPAEIDLKNKIKNVCNLNGECASVRSVRQFNTAENRRDQCRSVQQFNTAENRRGQWRSVQQFNTAENRRDQCRSAQRTEQISAGQCSNSTPLRTGQWVFLVCAKDSRVCGREFQKLGAEFEKALKPNCCFMCPAAVKVAS